MFEKIRKMSALTRLLDEKIYEQVHYELMRGEKRKGIWVKALADSGGLEEKANALYIKYRFQSIKDEMEISNIIAEETQVLLPSYTIWQAATLGDANQIHLIIESGANINKVDVLGQTAVDIAKKLGHTEVVRLLRIHGGKSANEL
jgi:hypothetical protein